LPPISAAIAGVRRKIYDDPNSKKNMPKERAKDLKCPLPSIP
jgi:hypothetical protein